MAHPAKARPWTPGLTPTAPPRGQNLEHILDLLGDLTGEISWTVHQSLTWSRGNPHGSASRARRSPRVRPLPGDLKRAGLLSGGSVRDFSHTYRPRGDDLTDPRAMMEALADYERGLRDMVDEAHDRMAGLL